MIIFLNLFKVRERAAKVIFVCCFRDPRGLLSRSFSLAPKYSCPELNSYNTLPSLYVCVWLVNTLTSTAQIGSPIICTWAPADICEQWQGNLTTRFSRRLWGSPLAGAERGRAVGRKGKREWDWGERVRDPFLLPRFRAFLLPPSPLRLPRRLFVGQERVTNR